MFISVKFSAQDHRAYTYVYDGEDKLAPGDFVIVEMKDGRKIVTVHEVDLPKPAFICKAITSILIEKKV